MLENVQFIHYHRLPTLDITLADRFAGVRFGLTILQTV